MDRELLPAPRDRRQRDRPRQDRPANWRLVRDNPHVIGDFTWTGWDYLGEAGIGRAHVRVGRPDRRAVLGAVPVAHRPRAATSTSPATAARCRTTGRSCGACAPSRTSRCGRPEHHGESNVGRRRGRSPTPSHLDVARRRGPARHGRGVRRRRRGRAAARRHVGRASTRGREATATAPSSRSTYAPGELTAVRVPGRRGDGSRARCARRAAEVAARRAGRPRARSTPTIATSRTSRSRWSTPAGTCTSARTGR